MNERIRELAEQARKHFPKTETSGEFWVFDEEKFAELIVRECGDLAFEHWALTHDTSPQESILEYFGIK
jgi:hypothetical protein